MSFSAWWVSGLLLAAILGKGRGVAGYLYWSLALFIGYLALIVVLGLIAR